MYLPNNDPIVEEKHKIQKKLLEEANGDLHEYSRIVREQVQKLNEKYNNKFKKAVIFNIMIPHNRLHIDHLIAQLEGFIIEIWKHFRPFGTGAVNSESIISLGIQNK